MRMRTEELIAPIGVDDDFFSERIAGSSKERQVEVYVSLKKVVFRFPRHDVHFILAHGHNRRMHGIAVGLKGGKISL